MTTYKKMITSQPFGPIAHVVTAIAVFNAVTGLIFAQSMYGTLSNFDVFNDTGQECHGFEIELDGLSSSDVVYEFASPNSQYPAPRLTDFAGGVYVDYESPFNSATGKWVNTTVVPAQITPTLGHQCWYGANPSYTSVGCEHFGLSLVRNPSSVHYRWLVQNTPGTLKKWATDVILPAPVWNVTPPPPIPNPPPAVIRALAPPPPENPDAPEPQFGDAVWLKSFVVQKPNHAELNKMVQDGPDDAPDADAEVEMRISQAGPPGAEKEVELDQNLGAGNKAVIRRYELYKYLGAYDPETHEVLCDDPTVCPEAVGNYIGSQIAAANIVAAVPVTAQITIGGFVYSRVTKSYVARVTVQNTGAQDAAAPLSIVFRNLANGASVVNPSGTVAGDPYLIFSPAGKLAAGASQTFYVQFQSAGGIKFNSAIYSGSLQ